MTVRTPTNADVAAQFELLADLIELEGGDAFRVNAYRRAATRISEHGGPVAKLALEGRAKELQGIGQTIEAKIVEIAQNGEMSALSKRKAAIPPEVVLFMRLPGLGPKTAARIWRELGVSTLEELHEAAAAERLRGLAGLGAKTEERILKALSAEAPTLQKRTLLGHGLPAVLAVVSVLREHPGVDRVSEAGSIRRRRETVRDLDVIATAADAGELTGFFTRLTWVGEVAAHGDTKATVVSHDGLRFDLRVVPPESFGNLLQHFTGSKAHNVALREDAVRRKLSISEYGIQDGESGTVFTAREEAAVYERLGYQFIAPELRENAGELEAARRGELPVLVERGDLRGDLHSHTTWSQDGKSTLVEMVEAAVARGHSYLAVTDHSHSLREGRLEAQAEEIDALAGRFLPFRIIKGIEVNIRADGSVDVPDEVLAERDWVMASVHSRFDEDLTERVLAAMENPHVDCIGHLTGRKLNVRPAADVAIERVIEKALETGTFLELNAQPNRLDLRDAHARLAGEAGVKVAISTDAHVVAALDHLEIGVAQARRAWLTREQVLNSRSWPELEELLAR